MLRPPNIARTVASIGSYMYAVAADEAAIHLYGDSTARLTVAGAAVTLTLSIPCEAPV